MTVSPKCFSNWLCQASTQHLSSSDESLEAFPCRRLLRCHHTSYCSGTLNSQCVNRDSTTVPSDWWSLCMGQVHLSCTSSTSTWLAASWDHPAYCNRWVRVIFYGAILFCPLWRRYRIRLWLRQLHQNSDYLLRTWRRRHPTHLYGGQSKYLSFSSFRHSFGNLLPHYPRCQIGNPWPLFSIPCSAISRRGREQFAHSRLKPSFYLIQTLSSLCRKSRAVPWYRRWCQWIWRGLSTHYSYSRDKVLLQNHPFSFWIPIQIYHSRCLSISRLQESHLFSPRVHALPFILAFLWVSCHF